MPLSKQMRENKPPGDKAAKDLDDVQRDANPEMRDSWRGVVAVVEVVGEAGVVDDADVLVDR